MGGDPQQRQGRAGRRRRCRGSIPLSSFAAEDLEQIEYTYNGETYTLQYSGGSWQLAQDPAYHLDESACNTMRTA